MPPCSTGGNTRTPETVALDIEDDGSSSTRQATCRRPACHSGPVMALIGTVADPF